MVTHWSLSDSKSSQVSRTILSILAEEISWIYGNYSLDLWKLCGRLIDIMWKLYDGTMENMGLIYGNYLVDLWKIDVGSMDIICWTDGNYVFGLRELRWSYGNYAMDLWKSHDGYMDIICWIYDYCLLDLWRLFDGSMEILCLSMEIIW